MSFFESANPVLPLWVVLPLATFAVLVIGMHLAWLPRAAMPESRRRIRMANGVLLLGLTMLLTYAIGFVGMLPDGGGSIGHARAFVIVWLSIMSLLPLVLGLAGLDMLNTYRLAREARTRGRSLRHAEMMRQVEIHVQARLASADRSAAGSRGGSGRRGADDDAPRR